MELSLVTGHAITQEVNCQINTAAARVRSQVRLCGICSGKSGTVVGFLQILSFPLSIFIPSTKLNSMA
jgi:hypothetical protein